MLEDEDLLEYDYEPENEEENLSEDIEEKDDIQSD